MSDEKKWLRRLEREKRARKEAEELLENKSLALWELNQHLEEEVKKRTLELEQALQEAKKANVAKDSFLANMSHEIRTPLNSIIGFVDIMLRKDMNLEKRVKYLGIIQNSGRNLLNIINDILDFSKIQSGKFTIDAHPVDLKISLSKNCVQFSSQAKENNTEYTFNFSKDFPQKVYADDTRIMQVVNNFVSNAIKFTKNGIVTLDVNYYAPEEYLEIKVQDNGIGIEEEKQKMIFSPFEQEDVTTTKFYGGTGLGLAISLSLIKLMDGELIFESKKGEGSLFGCKIPMKIVSDSLSIA